MDLSRLLFGHIESVHDLTSWHTYCGCIMSHCVASIRIPMNSAGRYRETVENWSKAYLDTVEQARLESRNLVLVGDREGL